MLRIEFSQVLSKVSELGLLAVVVLGLFLVHSLMEKVRDCLVLHLELSQEC